MRPSRRHLLALLAALAPLAANAHGLRVVYVEIGGGLAHARLAAQDPRLALEVSGCALEEQGGGPAELDRTYRLTGCEGGASLAGREIRLRGLGPITGEAVVRVQDGGLARSRLLTPDAPAWTVPAEDDALSTLAQYARLGAEHIATGYDHLLFLALLVLSLRRLRSVLWAETAFTASHSLTLSLTALGVLSVPSAWAEACIALSLVLVALDAGRGPVPPAWRGALTALLFGLVHGLGFAGGLQEIGLPDRGVLFALGGFAIGVELGQVAFIAAFYAVLRAGERLPLWSRLEPAAAVLAGSASALWLCERVVACLG